MPGFERDSPAPGPLIQGFAGRSLRIDGKLYDGVQLTPLNATGWEAPPLDRLSMADLEPLLALDPSPEFLLLGSGEKMTFPPRALRSELEAKGVAVEVMDSRAAARLWGLLRGEHRWIVAAIMPIQAEATIPDK